MRNVGPTSGFTSVFTISGKSNSFPCLTSPICLFVSGRKSMVKIAAMSVITPAIIKGTPSPKPMVKAATAGPNTNPKLKAAPTKPNARGRSSGFVESEITANTTGIFPAVNPSSARARNKNNAFGANAIIKNDATVPKIEVTNKGRLPYLSDKRPIIGVDAN